MRLYIVEGYNTSVLREQFGVSSYSVHRWAKAYRRQGAEGLVSKLPPGAKPKLTEAVKNRIVGVKRSHPEYGPRRIAAVLKRFFLVSASAASVHKTLSDEGLTKKAKSKPVKNQAKQRFFGKSRPKQLRQSNRHHSLSAGRAKRLPDRLFRRLLALHHQPWTLPQPDRRACVGELPAGGYRVRGAARAAHRQRQYTNWRGKTRFEREMKKDRVKHIRSRPHHPMTLCKIERFWKSIESEFLFRAQFERSLFPL